MNNTPKKDDPKSLSQVKITEKFSGQSSLKEIILQFLLNKQESFQPRGKNG